MKRRTHRYAKDNRRSSVKAGVSGGCAEQWSPGSIALGIWLDPSDLSTMFKDTAATQPVTADGDAVARINNKGSLGGSFQQATLANRPLYKTSAGLSWLEFDGTNDALVSAASFDFSAASSLTYAISVTPNSAGTSMMAAEFSVNVNSNAGAFYTLLNAGSGQQFEEAVSVGAAVDTVQSSSNTFGNGVTSLLTCNGMDITQAASASKMPLRRNSAALAVTPISEAAAAGTVYGNYPLHLGARGGTSLFAAMKLLGLVIKATPLSAADLASLELWMSGKSGL